MDIPIGKRPVKPVFGFNFSFSGKTKGSNKKKRSETKRQFVESSDSEDGNSDVQVSSPSVPSTPPIRIAAAIPSDRRIMEAKEAKKRIQNNDDTEVNAVNGSVFRRGEIISVPASNSKKVMKLSLEDCSKWKTNKQQTSTENGDTNESSSLEDVNVKRKKKKKEKTVTESDPHHLVLQPSFNSRMVLSKTAENGGHLEARDASTGIRQKKNKRRPFIDLADYNSEQEKEVVVDDGKDRSIKKKHIQSEVIKVSEDNASEEENECHIRSISEMTPPKTISCTRNNISMKDDVVINRHNSTNVKKKKKKNRAPVVLYSDDENEGTYGACSEMENESVVNGASKHSDLTTVEKGRKETLFLPDEANEAMPSSPFSLPINSNDAQIKLKKNPPRSYDTDLTDNPSEQEDRMKVKKKPKKETSSIITSKNDKFRSKKESRQPQLIEPIDDNYAREEKNKVHISEPIMVSPIRINVSKRDATALMSSADNANENLPMEDVSGKRKKRKKEKTFTESEPQQRILSSPNPPKVLSQEAESASSSKKPDANFQKRAKKDISCSYTDLTDYNDEEEVVEAGPSKKLKKDKDNMIASKVDKVGGKKEKRKPKPIVLADEDDSEEENTSQVLSISHIAPACPASPRTISPTKSNASEKDVSVLSPSKAKDKERRAKPTSFFAHSDDENQDANGNSGSKGDSGSKIENKSLLKSPSPSKMIDLPANTRQTALLLLPDEATPSPPFSSPTKSDMQVKTEDNSVRREASPPLLAPPQLDQPSSCVACAHNDEYRMVVELVVDENAEEYFKLQNANPTNMMDVPTEMTEKCAGTLQSDALVQSGVDVYPGVRRLTNTIEPDSLGVGYLEIQGKTVLPFEYHDDRTQVFVIIKGSITVKSAGSWYHRMWSGNTTYLHGETFEVGRTIIIKKDTLFSFENREETPALLFCSEVLHGNSSETSFSSTITPDRESNEPDANSTMIVPRNSS